MSKTERIDIRVSSEEKEKIQMMAESVKLDSSTFLRNLALIDGKVILLPGGHEIAENMSKLIKAFSHSYKGGFIDSKYCPIILTSIEELVSSVNQLIDKISDICGDDEKSQKEGLS